MKHSGTLQNASGWAHDIRTRLNILLGAVSMMETGKMSCEQIAEYASIMRGNVMAMLHMMDQLMDAEDGKAKDATLQDLRVEGLLRRAVGAARPYARERGVELLCDIDNSLTARCNAQLLDRVVYNLLSNAIKCTEPGGFVHLSAQMMDGTLNINVSDTGRGFMRDDLVRVQDHMDQGLYGGRGLRIVHSLMAAMEGRVALDSEEGRGTTFYLYLQGGTAADASDAADVSDAADIEAAGRAGSGYVSM